MAWLSSGRTNIEMVDRLMANHQFKSPLIAGAMKAVDRKNYVPSGWSAYDDSPHQAIPFVLNDNNTPAFPVTVIYAKRIGFNATISAPHMHAKACENLLDHLLIADRVHGAVLDVGSGSGYLTAVLHKIAPNATIVGIDHLQGLADLARTNLDKDGVKHGPGEKVEIVCGDGRAGWAAKAPYQAIHVGAAAPTMPAALVEQLAAPGRMFIPIGVEDQAIWQVDKDGEGNVTQKKLYGVMYVPLTDKGKQWDGQSQHDLHAHNSPGH